MPQATCLPPFHQGHRTELSQALQILLGQSVYFSREFKHSVDVLDYFPLQVGTSWTHRHTSKDLMGQEEIVVP